MRLFVQWNMAQTDPRRAEILKNFALIIQKSDPKHVHYYKTKSGAEDRIQAGAIRERPNDYEFFFEPVLNLGRLYVSLDSVGQRDLVTMAAHQMRRDAGFLWKYTPQIFAFLAKYFSFHRAFATAVEYLQMDELGWYTMLAVSDCLAHDHCLIDDSDLEPMLLSLLNKLESLEHEGYERERTTPSHQGLGRGPAFVGYWRTKNTAQAIAQQLQEIRHMRLIRGLSDSPVLQQPISGSVFTTGDAVLNGLLESARSKFLSNDTNLKREALEKIWDAWERLKTIEPARDKKESTRILLDRVSTEASFRNTLETEASELTSIGNNYMIRHTELNKTPITSTVQTEYLFHRMFGFIRLILGATARGG